MLPPIDPFRENPKQAARTGVTETLFLADGTTIANPIKARAMKETQAPTLWGARDDRIGNRHRKRSKMENLQRLKPSLQLLRSPKNVSVWRPSTREPMCLSPRGGSRLDAQSSAVDLSNPPTLSQHCN